MVNENKITTENAFNCNYFRINQIMKNISA